MSDIVPRFNSLQYGQGNAAELMNELLWLVDIVPRMVGDVDICGIFAPGLQRTKALREYV